MGRASALRLISDEYQASQLQDQYKHFRGQNLASFMPTEFNEMPSLAVTYDTLYKLYVQMREDPTTYQVHMRVVYTDGKVAALYLDREYLEKVGLTYRDTDFLAEQIAIQFREYFNERYYKNRHKDTTNKEFYD